MISKIMVRNQVVLRFEKSNKIGLKIKGMKIEEEVEAMANNEVGVVIKRDLNLAIRTI